MAWRKVFLIITLAVVLNACSLPQGVNFLRLETPVPNTRAVSPEPVEQPGVASSQAQDRQAASVDDTAAWLGRYTVQPGTPVGLVNFADPVAGCNWMGVGGQVFALDAKPVTGLIVELGGELAGKHLSQKAVTGVAQVIGPGGFLIVLSAHPLASQQKVWLQLLDPSGLAVSEKVYFNTYTGCDQNLILVNFTERILVQSTDYLPLVFNQKLYYYFPFVGQR